MKDFIVRLPSEPSCEPTPPRGEVGISSMDPDLYSITAVVVEMPEEVKIPIRPIWPGTYGDLMNASLSVVSENASERKMSSMFVPFLFLPRLAGDDALGREVGDARRLVAGRRAGEPREVGGADLRHPREHRALEVGGSPAGRVVRLGEQN